MLTIDKDSITCEHVRIVYNGMEITFNDHQSIDTLFNSVDIEEEYLKINAYDIYGAKFERTLKRLVLDIRGDEDFDFIFQEVEDKCCHHWV